jgi:hypothetical protein
MTRGEDGGADLPTTRGESASGAGPRRLSRSSVPLVEEAPGRHCSSVGSSSIGHWFSALSPSIHWPSVAPAGAHGESAGAHWPSAAYVPSAAHCCSPASPEVCAHSPVVALAQVVPLPSTGWKSRS